MNNYLLAGIFPRLVSDGIVSDSLARTAASALISSLWEGILLAVCVGICIRVVPQIGPRVRFIVWIVAFATIGALPLVGIFLAGHSSTTVPLAAAPHLQLNPRWSYALAALWLAAVIIRFTHFALQAIRVRILWKGAVPVSTDLLPELPLGRVELCLSTELDRPCVIGFFAPRILIPAWLFEQLTPAELHQVVLHELEHLKRRDDWMNLLQKISLAFFPLNPALFWIDGRLAVERELACDDGVLSRTCAPRAYATCLTNIAERRLANRRPNPFTALALAALGTVGAVHRSILSRRIESILRFRGRSSMGSAATCGLAALLIAGVFGGAATLVHAPQLVSFTSATEAQVVASPSTDWAESRNREVPPAHFENTAFRTPQMMPRKLRVAKLNAKPRPVTPTVQITGLAPQVDDAELKSASKGGHAWMVLAAWQPGAPQTMLVTLPNGRTFLVTYTAAREADMGEPGWLLIQL